MISKLEKLSIPALAIREECLDSKSEASKILPSFSEISFRKGTVDKSQQNSNVAFSTLNSKQLVWKILPSHGDLSKQVSGELLEII